MEITVDMAEVILGYVECALWSELDDAGMPLDQRFDQSDVTADALTAMASELQDFVAGCLAERPEIFDGMEPGQIGHDFWLTRNRYGAGFWDRGLGERGQWLTDMAHPYGSAMLYVTDSGRVEFVS